MAHRKVCGKQCELHAGGAQPVPWVPWAGHAEGEACPDTEIIVFRRGKGTDKEGIPAASPHC